MEEIEDIQEPSQKVEPKTNSPRRRENNKHTGEYLIIEVPERKNRENRGSYHRNNARDFITLEEQESPN